MKITTPGTYDIQRPMGIRFGLGYDILISGKLHFQSGLIFNSKGTDYTKDSIDISLAPTYLEMPLNVAVKLGRSRSKIKTVLYAGPYISTAIGGYRIYADQPLSNIAWGKGNNKDLRVFDFGFNVGAGISLKNTTFSLQYGIGVSNLSPVNSNIMKNRVIGISISSLNPPRKK